MSKQHRKWRRADDPEVVRYRCGAFVRGDMWPYGPSIEPRPPWEPLTSPEFAMAELEREMTAQLYAFPQRYILGVDAEDLLNAAPISYFAMHTDEDPDVQDDTRWSLTQLGMDATGPQLTFWAMDDAGNLYDVPYGLGEARQAQGSQAAT